jgi:hypothetical protein
VPDDILSRCEGGGDGKRVPPSILLKHVCRCPSVVRVPPGLGNFEPDGGGAGRPRSDILTGRNLSQIGDQRSLKEDS